ncbi:MAG: hypothetical protein OXP09_20310 [Gammaproteobacteria bacterium]|nr:hypothetical protein [Gammaproteobacteria bacterium]MDE0367902.1 hypothetical protein [Gammaproteobacteria bacterium]
MTGPVGDSGARKTFSRQTIMSKSMSSNQTNQIHWKTVIALGTATWLVTGLLAGCGSEEGARSGQVESEDTAALTQPVVEGKGAAAAGAGLTTDDAAYLTRLGLIRGHLAVGYALYQRDLPLLSETHMKHPREEIYASVVPAFDARGCDGFASDLTSLTEAVTARVTHEEVAVVYEGLTANIARCELAADTNDPAVVAKVIENLLRTAGVEYQIGVVDGAINNLHEYQDAWGFTQVAGSWARSTAFTDRASAAAVAAQLQDIIAGLEGLWPSLNPEGGVDGDAAEIFGAAARVQIAALPLQR